MRRRQNEKDRDLASRAAVQAAEEMRLIQDFFGDTPGFFVEVGAGDPEQYSQTLHLERMGWKGVLIEPRPDMVEKLRLTRTAKVHAAACSSPENAGKLMTLSLAGFHSTLDSGKMVHGAEREGAVEVSVVTLDSILVQSNAPTPIDLVSIDVEGHEASVLEGFSTARWQPRLILIEDQVRSLAVHRMLRVHGYRWVRRTGLNSWYVAQNSAIKPGILSRLQFVRKYYLGLPVRRLRDTLRSVRAR